MGFPAHWLSANLRSRPSTDFHSEGDGGVGVACVMCACVLMGRTFAAGGGGAFLPKLTPPCTYSLPPTEVNPWFDLAVGRCPLVPESSVQVMVPGSNEYRSLSGQPASAFAGGGVGVSPWCARMRQSRTDCEFIASMPGQHLPRHAESEQLQIEQSSEARRPMALAERRGPSRCTRRYPWVIARKVTSPPLMHNTLPPPTSQLRIRSSHLFVLTVHKKNPQPWLVLRGHRDSPARVSRAIS